MAGSYNLQRFVSAQEPIYGRVLVELRSGRKHTHWMWFIFPQIAGLGYSETSRWFAISSIDEAKAYLNHPVVGARLQECTGIVNRLDGPTAHQIFGNPDCMKFQSCMTLFSRAAGEDSAFHAALVKYFDGQQDAATVNRL